MKKRMPASLMPRGHLKADGILDYLGRFDLDQPTDYLSRISPKWVSTLSTAGRVDKKRVRRNAPQPQQRITAKFALHMAIILPTDNDPRVDASQTFSDLLVSSVTTGGFG